jgi:exosortase A-associated hydrolase 2
MQAAAAQLHLEPTMIAGGSGPLFAVHYAPTLAHSGRAVIYLPPFAEELNRSRKMASLQARSLAASGIGTLVLDPYGCGDSAGDFRDARWQGWRDDVARAVQWLQQRGYEDITLLGLRLGALLALQAAADRSDDIRRVILWQPVLRGDQFVTQFLRLRLAADLSANSGGGEGTAALRREIADTGGIEIAGYELDRELVDAIDSLRLAELGLACPAPIDWIDVVSAADQGATPAQDAVLKRWQGAGKTVRRQQAVGVPFWSLQETAIAPALVTATTNLMASP